MATRPPTQQRDPSGVGRWASEEERGLEMMRNGWWWQAGPVTNCCGCFTIRTGVYLLSLWNMIYGVGYIKTEHWRIPLLVQDLQKARAKGNISQEAGYLEFLQASVPAYHVIGVFYILFSLLGWRAGYTNNPKFARLFMAGFPSSYMIDVCMVVVSPLDEPPLFMIWRALLAVYFTKVAWSFYTRLRIAEQANRILAEGGLGDEGVGGGALTGRRTASAGSSSSNGIELNTYNP